MRTVDAVDNEIRFTDTWGGLTRYVFIPDPFVSDDAGRTLCRDEAVAYVRANLGRYRGEARAQHGKDNLEKIVILRRPVQQEE